MQIKAVVGCHKIRAWIAQNISNVTPGRRAGFDDRGSYQMCSLAMRFAKHWQGDTKALQRLNSTTDVRLLIEKCKSETASEINQAAADAGAPPTETLDGWPRLVALVQSADMLHFSIDHDSDSPTVALTAFYANGKRETICRGNLAAVLLATAGDEQPRRCPKCGATKEAKAFAGSTQLCRVCERARVKRWDVKQRRKKARSVAASR